MYGTLKKIIAFAGSKEGLLKKSLLFALLSGLFAALQFAALFIVVEALVSDNRDRRFIWISLGIMPVILIPVRAVFSHAVCRPLCSDRRVSI